MLSAYKRRKSRPDVQPQTKSSTPQTQAQVVATFGRRSSLGSPRLPLSPLQSGDMHDSHHQQQNNIFIGRAILSPDEQQKVANQSPSLTPPNFALPRRDPSSSPPSSPSSSSSARGVEDTPDQIYTINTLASFNFGPATQHYPPPSPGRSIGPLDEVDEDDMRRRGADETPRPSVTGSTATARAASRRDPRTPAAHYSPSRSDAASHHTFGTSSASSLSSPSRSGSRSRTTSSTTHTSLTDNDLGGVTFNPIHHHPTLPPDVEFDSEEDVEFIEDEPYDDHDLIEVSSARGGGSIDGAHLEAFERQMYSDVGSLASARRPSLPMPIPGMSPDDFPSSLNRRDREGSLATVRRASRSLDDQVSVLTLGDTREHSGSTSAHNAPSTVSVPESDGDWRSLSARVSAQRESPAANTATFTMPTFASPIPSSTRNSVSGTGSASFETFGFDLDWTAMRSGITGLDMSDIAVHSSTLPSASSQHKYPRRPSQLSLMLRRPSTASGGSVMYDPDTFLTAVRSWGGEEYERQRKYWTFRRDLADGRGGTARPGASGAGVGPSGAGAKVGVALGPVRSITGSRGTSVRSGHYGHDKDPRDKEGKDRDGRPRPTHMLWRGMALNAEEIWNSSLVGSFKVRRIELRPQKPQQRVTIDPFRGPYTLGPKPPHDGAYTNIHKHSKVMAFSIHRHYKPTRAPPLDARGSFSASASAAATGSPSEQRGSVSAASGRHGQNSAGEERRRLTAMILLAPRHVQEAYTSTNTTKGLRSHGLLDDGRDREKGREYGDGRDVKGEKKDKEKGKQKDKTSSKGSGKSSSSGSTSSTASASPMYRNDIISPTRSAPAAPTYSLPSSVPDSRDASFIGPTLAARSASSSRRKRRDSLDMEDSDSDTERVSSRTTHNEAFSTMDASSIDQLVSAQDARYSESSNGVLSFLRRTPVHPMGPGGGHKAPYSPPWLTLQSRVKQEERRRRHDVLSNSFEDVGLLPPKKNTGGVRAKKARVAGVDIFAQVPPDALFMLLPLWPGPTDPVSERNATRQPHEIPPEQRQYLLVSYKPTDERPQPTSSKKQDREERTSKKGSSHSSPTSSGDGGSGKGCDILLTSYHISARLVSHADLQGSGVRVPDEGLAVLGPWHEAWLTMPQIASRDHGLLVIGRCESRDAGIEFDPEGLVKMGLCVPVPPEPGSEEEEPVAELTPIGKAVLEMAWIGCIAVTSFGPTPSS